MRGRWTFIFPVLLTGACSLWLGLVSKIVPEPYLDEVFHIPQAQKYCAGKFREWDDKITTPPGLYFLSVLGMRLLGTVQGDEVMCDARVLRATNAASLIALSYVALLCRQQIESKFYEDQHSKKLRVRSVYAAHTAFNVALFPLLFFFSGLYYTDVVSTTVVVLAFLNHLSRTRRQTASIASDLVTVFLGISTLFMRQTNVFWVVVFMGGLEAVHAVKSLRPQPATRPADAAIWDQLRYSISRYAVGEIHDPALNQAWPDDAIFTILSLAVAVICNPVTVMRQIWPYVTALVAFSAFVVWNGSVVLGDKTNHVATIHLAQMLYIWPFFAFFSLPLLVSSLWPSLDWVYRVLVGKKTQQAAATPSTEAPLASNIITKGKVLLWLLYVTATVLASFAIVKYNTIIHPFTLADNRHYMFYVFRYTIRRATWIRYALVLPYTASRWMVWATLAGCLGSTYGFVGQAGCSRLAGQARKTPFNNYPIWVPESQTSKQETSVQRKGEPKKQDVSKESLAEADTPYSDSPIPTSTALIFLLATALSLITAPLVEPRYFIIPWVMWRLLIPAWRPHSHAEQAKTMNGQAASASLLQSLATYDIRLILETLWFVGINLATGYMFLTRPYQWKATDGSLLDDGRWQRFMW